MGDLQKSKHPQSSRALAIKDSGGITATCRTLSNRNRGPSRRSSNESRDRCSHDENSLPPQPAPWLQRVFTRRAKARPKLPSASPAKRLALICPLTLSACL